MNNITRSYIVALLISLGVILALVPKVDAQQPQQDPQIAMYRQLLDNANAQLVAVAVQLAQAQAKIKELEDKYEPKK